MASSRRSLYLLRRTRHETHHTTPKENYAITRSPMTQLCSHLENGQRQTISAIDYLVSICAQLYLRSDRLCRSLLLLLRVLSDCACSEKKETLRRYLFPRVETTRMESPDIRWQRARWKIQIRQSNIFFSFCFWTTFMQKYGYLLDKIIRIYWITQFMYNIYHKPDSFEFMKNISMISNNKETCTTFIVINREIF